MALLAAALQYVDVPGYAALLLRRTFKDLALPGALMDVSHQWLRGTDARWKAAEHQWEFPSGATLTFGYLETENDKYRYQSAEFQFVGFDELTQFTESQYRYLFSRLRRKAGVDVPLRMRSASNPGGVGHDWVKLRFIDGAGPKRVFIRAKLTDNPHLDREAYRRALAELDPVTRAQLESGDWSVRSQGRYFRREWFDVVDDHPRGEQGAAAVRYWDLAATEPKPGKDPDYTVGVKMVRTPAGVCYIADLIRVRTTPGNVEAIVKQTAQLDGYDVPIWIEQEGGASGKSLIDHYRRDVLRGFAFRGDPVSGDKVQRAAPFSAACEAGNVKLVRGRWIADFLDELDAFPEGAHDDQVDAAAGAFRKLSRSVVTVAPSVY